MRGTVALLVSIAWSGAAHARDDSVELELRASRSSFGMRAQTMSGSGVHEYRGAQSLTVSPRDEGYRRPTFSVVGLAVGIVSRNVAVFATASGGSGGADQAPAPGYEPALNAGASRLMALGIEPRVRVSFDNVSFALGVHAAVGWISAPFRELRPPGPCRFNCDGRATGTQMFLTPRAIITWRLLDSKAKGPISGVTFSAFAGVDPLYGGPSRPAMEFGLAVGLAAPIGRS